ncbi:aldehyde dehydrogenase [Rhodococcus sp. ARC_M8]|uniref:aldehyde dehydrogenase n=1 Tax=Rhodococcus sp. ARC_M8 TaxID=2928853 RepID=UPI001FB22882|nr:aldehyde dehydrogenase [Rhodococcus sp. ARC_M8]MCJ0949896.1 aldehyde dehydrogenase [Rhodococcus sp. ARC_M8]
MTIDYDKLYIDGKFRQTSSGSTIVVTSPTTGQTVGLVPEADTHDVDCAVAAARRAFDDPTGWSQWDAERRGTALERFAAALEKHGNTMAERVSVQNGMPISLANALEAAVPALMVRFYAQMMKDLPQEELRPGMFGGSSRVIREPVGVVAAVVPWNVPQGISFLKLAPALAAGCSVVLKPAPETVLDAQLLGEIAIEAGLPDGVLNIVPGRRDIGAYLVGHPGIDKVSFTGSTDAGRAIAETCGRLLRPVTLELGGKSAAIVLDDADLSAHLEAFFNVSFIHAGQICYMNSRILVPRSRYSDVLDTIVGFAESVVVGDPLDPMTQMGPLVSQAQRDRVEGYITKGVSDGARLVTGGGRPKGLDSGLFVQPTVFADVDNGSTIAQEEIFGPVLAVIPYENDDAAVAIANASDFGLGGTVWTADRERGEAIARRVHTGTIGINAYAQDPTAPFGGVKNSGLGREMGPEALQSYQVVKSIYRDPMSN